MGSLFKYIKQAGTFGRVSLRASGSLLLGPQFSELLRVLPIKMVEAVLLAKVEILCFTTLSTDVASLVDCLGQLLLLL